MSSSDDENRDAQPVGDTPAEQSAPAVPDSTAGADPADTDTPTAAARDTDAQPRRRRFGGARWVERTVSGVVIVAAVFCAVWFFVQDHNQKALAASRTQARNAACSYASVLADYDSSNLDAYFHAVLAGASGNWKQQFADTSRDLRDVLVQGQVVSKVGDVQCAVQSGDANHASVVVVVGQSVSSVATKGKPQPGQLSMVLSLTKTNGHWLTDKVDTPLAPADPTAPQPVPQPGQP